MHWNYHYLSGLKASQKSLWFYKNMNVIERCLKRCVYLS